MTVIRKTDGTGYAVWNCRLSPKEYETLSSGTHPLLVRPYSLIYYVDGPNATALYKKFQDSEENS